MEIRDMFFKTLKLAFIELSRVNNDFPFPGLSYLISSSMQEDRYGVVQKDLPRVISCLFVLQKVSFTQLIQDQL